MKIHYYGYEIQPVSAYELNLNCVMLIDPSMDSFPESMMNWAMNQFVQVMMKKLLYFSGKLKGTKYENKLKNSEN